MDAEILENDDVWKEMKEQQIWRDGSRMMKREQP